MCASEIARSETEPGEVKEDAARLGLLSSPRLLHTRPSMTMAFKPAMPRPTMSLSATLGRGSSRSTCLPPHIRRSSISSSSSSHRRRRLCWEKMLALRSEEPPMEEEKERDGETER